MLFADKRCTVQAPETPYLVLLDLASHQNCLHLQKVRSHSLDWAAPVPPNRAMPSFWKDTGNKNEQVGFYGITFIRKSSVKGLSPFNESTSLSVN